MCHFSSAQLAVSSANRAPQKMSSFHGRARSSDATHADPAFTTSALKASAANASVSNAGNWENDSAVHTRVLLYLSVTSVRSEYLKRVHF